MLSGTSGRTDGLKIPCGEQWHSEALKIKAGFQNGTRQGSIHMAAPQFSKEFERTQTNGRIDPGVSP